MKFSWRWLWRRLSSALLHRVDWYEFTDVSEVCTASIIKAMNSLIDDEGITDVWNSGKLTWVYKALQPRRQPSSEGKHICASSRYVCQSCFVIERALRVMCRLVFCPSCHEGLNAYINLAVNVDSGPVSLSGHFRLKKETLVPFGNRGLGLKGRSGHGEQGKTPRAPLEMNTVSPIHFTLCATYDLKFKFSWLKLT
jgi:hypothetical protein